MSQINGSLKIEGETVHFSFNRFFAAQGDRYFVSINRGRKFWIFYLSNESGIWRFIGNPDSVPEWLRDNEAKLSVEINKAIDS